MVSQCRRGSSAEHNVWMASLASKDSIIKGLLLLENHKPSPTALLNIGKTNTSNLETVLRAEKKNVKEVSDNAD